jgi:hypothetical protein
LKVTFAILHALGMSAADLFKPRSWLEAENLFLRHQLNVAIKRAPSRFRLHGSDRALLVWITRIWPNLLDLARVVKLETILRWHRALRGLLALEIAKQSRAAEDRSRLAWFYPPDV